jgi:hypothetical protein
VKVVQLLRQGERACRFHGEDDPDDVAEKIAGQGCHSPLGFVDARLLRGPHPQADVGFLPRPEATDWQAVDLRVQLVALCES